VSCLPGPATGARRLPARRVVVEDPRSRR